MGFLPLVYGISKLDSLLFVLDFAPWMQMQTLRVKINVCVDMNVCVCARIIVFDVLFRHPEISGV